MSYEKYLDEILERGKIQNNNSLRNNLDTSNTPQNNTKTTAKCSTKYQASNIDVKSKPKKLSTGKKFIVAFASIFCAGIIGASIFQLAKKDTKKYNGDDQTSTSISDMNTGNINDLGVELEIEKSKQYVSVTGDIDVDKVTRGNDGDLYVDEQSAENASKVGQTITDTKGGKLEVRSDGDVYEKTSGYEIVDEDGNVIESGDGDIDPDTYDAGGIDYVECPCNYYDDEGTLVHPAGEYITPEELDLCKQYYHTTKPVKSDEQSITKVSYNSISSQEDTTSELEETIIEDAVVEEQQTSTEQTGVTNSDGTFTIYGTTYASYADYQQYIIDGGEGYGFVNGIITSLDGYEIEYTK